MKSFEIYTDGSCLKNPDGPGGWAYVQIENKKVIKKIAGGSSSTTNNRMELMAVIEALQSEKSKSIFKIHSDSQYVVNSVNLWIDQWRKKNWKNGKVKNQDLMERLLELKSFHYVQMIWVKGHDGNEYNELCDQMANAQATLFNK